jgi:hypothetical protein
LTFQTDGNAIFDTVFILDMKGMEVKMSKQFIDNKIDVHDLPQGTYIIRGSTGKIIREGKFIKN